jgi:4-hydroxy-tetrahydrodipicolinate synthase
MKKNYGGVWPTMITAFDDCGKLDLEGNAAIAEYLINKGADGLFAVCQSSEMFNLTLEEKVALAECIVKAANGRVPVIASGHTSETIEDQIEELKAVSKTGVEAVVLVSNRLAKENEDSTVLLTNLRKIMDAIPDVKFGVYECPYPYRRLLTEEELKWCIDSNRVVFLKDVSCDIEIEKRRIEIAKGSELKLFNANTETLLDSLIAGYDGYNGVMGNFHIDIYKWLFNNYASKPDVARELQNQLTKAAEIEKFAYPINAKYHMQLENVKMGVFSRKLSKEVFTEERKNEVRELLQWENDTRKNVENIA